MVCIWQLYVGVDCVGLWIELVVEEIDGVCMWKVCFVCEVDVYWIGVDCVMFWIGVLCVVVQVVLFVVIEIYVDGVL